MFHFSCNGMFDDFKFDNGTGVRCWVNTYATRSETAHVLQKIDIPLFPDKGIANFQLIGLRSFLEKNSITKIKISATSIQKVTDSTKFENL